MDGEIVDKPLESADIEGMLIPYRDIVEEQTELICRFNPAKKITFVNDSYCSYFRKTRADLIGHSFMAHIHKADRKKSEKLLSSLDRKNPVATADHRVLLPNGKVRWQQWTHRAIFDDQILLVEYQAVGRDLTERILAEKVLRESEERYRMLISKMFNGFALFEILLDEKGKPCDCLFVEVNPAFEDRTGLVADCVVGKTLREVLPETRQSWIDACARIAFKGRPVQFKKGFKQFGKDFEVLAYSPQKGQFAAVFTDVTQRVKMEMTLRESEHNFRALAENSNDGIRITSRDGKHLYVNDRYAAITGYSIAELKKLKISDLALASEEAEMLNRHERLLEGEFSPTRYESAVVRQDGQKVPIDVTASRTKWKGRSAVMVTIRDISLRKQMENAIRSSANNFRNLAESANDGIVMVAEDGGIVYVNRRFSEITGYSVNKLQQLRFNDLAHPDELKKISRRHCRRLAGKPVPPRYETVLIKKGGIAVPVEVTGSKTVWLGQPAVLRIIRDITLRKQTEEALGKAHNELERRVDERTRELTATAEKLAQKQTELLDHKLDLEKANKELVHTNTALSVLAKNIDRKRDRLENQIAQTICSRILPLIDELQRDKVPEKHRANLDALTAFLNDLIPGATKGHDIIVCLSAMELRVAMMIKKGFKSEEVARLLHISPLTVKTHRKNIRRKLNLKNSKINLMSYLQLKLEGHLQ